MSIVTPPLVEQEAEALITELLARLPGYVPGWQPVPDRPSWALIQIYGRYLQALAERLALAPDKNKLAFYDLLGLNVLPPQAARAPLVFKGLSHVGDSRVPVRTQAGAQVPGQDQPLTFETENAIALAAANLAEVVTIWPGKDGYADHTAAALGRQSFDLFEPVQSIPHELYLAHATHFALAGQSTVELQFELSLTGSQPLSILWEYWDGELWRGFKPFVIGVTAKETDSLDSTDGLTRSGIIRLVADCAETKKTKVKGLENYWIRGRITSPIPPQPGLTLPQIDRISIRTIINRMDGAACPELLPDAAFADALKVDPSKTIYPFGQQPQPGSTFYLSSEEIFTKPGAVMRICTQIIPPDVACSDEPDDVIIEVAAAAADPQPGAVPLPTPNVAWEYWNGRRWVDLGVVSQSARFLTDGTISITIPTTMTATKVNDQIGLWLRARLTTGGYGCKRTLVWNDGSGPNSITVIEPAPPVLQSLRLGYTYQSAWDQPQDCLTYNDFQWTVRSEEARWRGGAFEPFSLVDDRSPTLYLGFDRPLPADLISLYFDIEEVTGRLAGPLLNWEYWNGSTWAALTAKDETKNLVLPGMISLLWPGTPPLSTGEAITATGTTVELANARQAANFKPGDLLYLGDVEEGELATLVSITGKLLTLQTPLENDYQRAPISRARLPRFGRPRTWIRARLQSDGGPTRSQVNGVFLNAVWAAQMSTIENERIGSSNGYPNQVFFFRQSPVLADEIVEVRELSGPRAAVELPILQESLAQQGLDADSIRTVSDPRSGHVTEVWVRWTRKPNFFFSGPDDRHYLIERSRGRLIFGDNQNGRIPPAGADNIRARSYRSGGGQAGNVAVEAINQLLSGVLAETVTNPRAAEGGADGEITDAVLRRGPQVTRHRYQAISLADYEALAREASPAVAVARALPLTHPSGRFAPGWVKLIIMPQSREPQPQPSFELRRLVKAFLAARVAAGVADQIEVMGPDYLPIGVEAVVAPVDLNAAATVLADVMSALENFLHPLSGGPDNLGWPFGRDVYLSDVAALLEAVPGVDYVATINLLLDGTPRGEVIDVPPNRIVVAGPLRITLTGSEG